MNECKWCLHVIKWTGKSKEYCSKECEDKDKKPLRFHLEKNRAIQTYAYFNHVSGFKGIIPDYDLPELLKIWKKYGKVYLNKKEHHIIIWEKDVDVLESPDSDWKQI